MRDIKFRGKREDANEWLYGFFFKTNKSNPLDEPTHWIINDDSQRMHRVIPESVEEFTGHHDIDGDEIYDGHILKYEKHDEPYTVMWSNDDAGFVCENSTNYMLPAVWNEMRIIGNVYEAKQ